MVTSCVGPPHLWHPPRRRPHSSDAVRGSYKTSYAVEVANAFLDGPVLTPVGVRERGPLRAHCDGRRCRQATMAKVAVVAGEPLVQRQPLGVEVVATAGEAAQS
jgi:hypothetical protein